MCDESVRIKLSGGFEGRMSYDIEEIQKNFMQTCAGVSGIIGERRGAFRPLILEGSHSSLMSSFADVNVRRAGARMIRWASVAFVC